MVSTVKAAASELSLPSYCHVQPNIKRIRHGRKRRKKSGRRRRKKSERKSERGWKNRSRRIIRRAR